MQSLLEVSHPAVPKNRQPSGWSTAYVLEAAFLFIGFGLLLWVGGTIGRAWLYQSIENYQFEQGLKGQGNDVIGYLRFLANGGKSAPTSSTEAALPGEEEANSPAQSLRDDGLIGRIEIPRLKVSAIVREGVDHDTLSRAVGHVPQTALPGQPGNVGVAAHRDTFFRGLRNVRKGDVIQIETPGKTFQYEVDSLKIVWPKNVEVLDPTPQPSLTLVTCYPFNYVGSAPKRFIVRAKQISRP